MNYVMMLQINPKINYKNKLQINPKMRNQILLKKK